MRVTTLIVAPPGAVFTARAVAGMASSDAPVTAEGGREVGHVVDAELVDPTTVRLTLEITNGRTLREISRTAPDSLRPQAFGLRPTRPEECSERPRRDQP